MSSIVYKHLSLSELKCLSKCRNLSVGGNKKDLIARLVYDDLKSCSVDVIKVLLKNRGLPTGGIKKDLQQRLAAACSSGGASLLPGSLAAVSSPSSMVPKNHKNKFLLDTAQGSSSGSQFEEAENSVFPGLGMEVVPKKVKRETEAVSTSVSHRGSKSDGKVLLQEWEEMSLSPLAKSTPIGKGVSNIKKTLISGQSAPGCLVTPMKKIAGSKRKSKMEVGMNVQEQVKALSEFKTKNKPGPVARILVTREKKQNGRSKCKTMCEQEVQEQGKEECNGMVVKGQKKSLKKVMSRQIEEMVYMKSGNNVMDHFH